MNQKPERKRVFLALLPAFLAAIAGAIRLLPINADLRGFLMGTCIGISLVALGFAVRGSNCAWGKRSTNMLTR